jgi:hypothetical protein
MTTDDDLLRQVTAYLDECEGTTILPESILDHIRADLPKTSQDRPSWLARFFDMSTPLKIGIAAAVVAVVAFLGLNWMGTIQVGPPSASNRATPSPEASGEVTALPPELDHVFLGAGKPSLEIDASWVDFRSGVLQFSDVGPVMTSAAGIAADGRLRVETAVADRCGEGDIGFYAYAVSPGGSLLTIEPGTDACSARADILPGTYERSECRDPNDECLGLVEAGTYRSHYFEPQFVVYRAARHGAMTFTVPDGWAAYADWPARYGLTPRADYERPQTDPSCYDCLGDRDTITVLGNPRAASEDCAEERPAPGIGSGIADLADWLAGHPGLVASDPESRTINGLAAITLVIEGSPEWTGTCGEEDPFVAVPVFVNDGDYHTAVVPGDQLEITLIDLGFRSVVAVVVNARDEGDFESFVDAARPIVESFEFPAP